MGLSALNSALSGLKVNQQQIDVISNNVANVGTEGYTRKILPQSSQVIDGRTIGVQSETIIRNIDLRLQRDLWTQVSAVDFYGVQETYLDRIDQFHGAPADGVSIAAEVSKLQDKFSALADAPDDQFLQTDVLDQARNLAEKFNSLSNYITTLRNDAQSEASVTIESINDLLVQIADLNSQVRFALNGNRTAAAMEDSRDQAIKELATLMDITVFRRGDGVLVIQSGEGVELASEVAEQLTFRATPLSSSSYYPETAAAVYVGDPLENPNAIDITDRDVGGKLGGLLQLRDYTFPKQMAQLDELAHKMALRFDAQGLRLFTDSSGGIPADTPPDLSTDPPTPVEYVGFSGDIQVNSLVMSDKSLIQRGTYGGSVVTGSNEVIRRVVEFAFSNIDAQIAQNQDMATSVDIRAAATGGTTLQNWLGLASTNTVTSGISLSNYTSIANMITQGGDEAFGGVGSETDRFVLRFDDPDIGGGPYNIEIDLRAVAVSGSGAAQDLIDHITADADWANAVADYDASLSVNSQGQLVINSRSDIEIDNSGIEPMSDLAFQFIGFSESLIEAQDPYFEVQVGNKTPVRITIEPTDTEVELLAKLNAIEGVAAQIDANGFLAIRPGNSFNNPDFGGDLRIVGGAFTTDNATLAGTAAGRTTIDDGVNIAYALFGTYMQIAPGIYEGFAPVVDVEYQSETEVGSGVYVSFRNTLLGPSASVETEINQSQTLSDLSQKIVNESAQELALIKARGEDEYTLQGLLQQRILDDSSVNIDEELGFLIVVQTAYAASARVITAVQEIYDELLRAV